MLICFRCRCRDRVVYNSGIDGGVIAYFYGSLQYPTRLVVLARIRCGFRRIMAVFKPSTPTSPYRIISKGS
jgi:hypothetical protein